MCTAKTRCYSWMVITAIASLFVVSAAYAEADWPYEYEFAVPVGGMTYVSGAGVTIDVEYIDTDVDPLNPYDYWQFVVFLMLYEFGTDNVDGGIILDRALFERTYTDEQGVHYSTSREIFIPYFEDVNLPEPAVRSCKLWLANSFFITRTTPVMKSDLFRCDFRPDPDHPHYSEATHDDEYGKSGWGEDSYESATWGGVKSLYR